jgi:tRNA-Thr(GGU) m(6)t(6)A37 methyltransferase TsaA
MIALEPIGYVNNNRHELTDDYWGSIVSQIVLNDNLDPECLQGLETFSHAEIIFYFDQVDASRITLTARHPRNNAAWPKVGIFAQRAKNRPNQLGLTTVRIVRREGRTLYVENLDAVNNTPVLDIKPVMAEFLPQAPIRQPEWSHELMQQYWLPEQDMPQSE